MSIVRDYVCYLYDRLLLIYGSLNGDKKRGQVFVLYKYY